MDTAHLPLLVAIVALGLALMTYWRTLGAAGLRHAHERLSRRPAAALLNRLTITTGAARAA